MATCGGTEDRTGTGDIYLWWNGEGGQLHRVGEGVVNVVSVRYVCSLWLITLRILECNYSDTRLNIKVTRVELNLPRLVLQEHFYGLLVHGGGEPFYAQDPDR